MSETDSLQYNIIQYSSFEFPVIYPTSDCSQSGSENKVNFTSKAFSGHIIVAFEFLFGMGACVWTE